MRTSKISRIVAMQIIAVIIIALSGPGSSWAASGPSRGDPPDYRNETIYWPVWCTDEGRKCCPCCDIRDERTCI
jgi:hypothetical protein